MGEGTTHILFRLIVPTLLLVPIFVLGPTIPAIQAEGSERVYLPILNSRQNTMDCNLPNASYGQLSVEQWQPGDHPAASHADINLALRGYRENNGLRQLVDYGGERDLGAPQLYRLFANGRTPTFRAVHRVHQWDWDCGCRASTFEPPTSEWPVTFVEMGTTSGEQIHVPDRAGGNLSPEGYKVLVLYASETQVTLKYTREDNVLEGYTLHIENICPDPALLALYDSLNQTGRHHLPALRGGQVIGFARGARLGVAIRDRGYWMDPRSRKDWWYGR